MSKTSEEKSRLIKTLGGNGRVAEICGVTPGAVSQWTFIPSQHVSRLWDDAQKRNIAVDLEDFFISSKKKSKNSPQRN